MGMSSEDPDDDQPLDFSISSRRRSVNADPAYSPAIAPQQQLSVPIIHHHPHLPAFPYALPLQQQQQQQQPVLVPPSSAASLRLPVPEPRTGLWLQGLADAAAYAHFRRRFLSNTAAVEPIQHSPSDRDNLNSNAGGEAERESQEPESNDNGGDDDDEEQERRNTHSNNSNGNSNVIKDEAYWERRRKNNEAAKRSRDARRAKEDEIAIRAAFLEQENLKLRVEVAALKTETAKLRCMLYNS